MEIKRAFSLGRPTLFGRMRSKFGDQAEGSQLRQASWKLSAESRDGIEQALSGGSLENQVDNFASTLNDLKGKEDNKAIYAVTVLGMEHLNELSDNPLIDVATGAASDGAHVVHSAEPEFLVQLTDAALTGLEAFRKDSSSSPFELAGTLEDQVGFLTESMSPALEKIHPQVKSHLSMYETARSGLFFGDGDTLRELGQNPDRPLAATLRDVIQETIDLGIHDDMQNVDAAILGPIGIGLGDDPKVASLLNKIDDRFNTSGYRLSELLDLLEQESRQAPES